MNAKKCKTIRQFLRSKGKDFSEAIYEVHPTQKGVRTSESMGADGVMQAARDGMAVVSQSYL